MFKEASTWTWKSIPVPVPALAGNVCCTDYAYNFNVVKFSRLRRLVLESGPRGQIVATPTMTS